MESYLSLSRRVKDFLQPAKSQQNCGSEEVVVDVNIFNWCLCESFTPGCGSVLRSVKGLISTAAVSEDATVHVGAVSVDKSGSGDIPSQFHASRSVSPSVAIPQSSECQTSSGNSSSIFPLSSV